MNPPEWRAATVLRLAPRGTGSLEMFLWIGLISKRSFTPMLWYDSNRKDPQIAFIFCRGTIKEIERVDKIVLKEDGGWRRSRMATLTFTDGSTRRTHFDFSSEPEELVGKEIVIWRHSHMESHEREICFAEVWDRELITQFQQIVEDPEKTRQVHREYLTHHDT